MKVLFKEKGLPIFEVRDGGKGSLHDGNLARNIFKNHAKFMSEQCGVSEKLIVGFWHLYVALASKLPLCPTKIDTYCKDLKALYISEFPWYQLNPSMHKVLEHSAEIIRLFPPTITSGMLSEEGSESANKDIKAWQNNHSRQSDPVKRNLDTFHPLMDRSDPLVLLHFDTKKSRKIYEPFPKEVLDFCKDATEILMLQMSDD